MVKQYQWYRAALYSLLGLVAAVFLYGQAMAVGDTVVVESTLPSEDSVIPTSYSPLVIGFSGAMNGASLTTDTVRLSYVSGESTVYVSGTVDYYDDGYTLWFTPDENLPAETTFTFGLTDAVVDLGSNAVGPYSIQFATSAGVDSTPPSITAEYPIDSSTNVDVWTPSISLYFGEQLTPTASYGYAWSSNVPLDTVDTYFDYSMNAIVIELEPDALEPETAYEITFDASEIVDMSGNPMAGDYVLNFTTAAENSTDYNWDDPANQMWNPRYVWPEASLAGLTTKYHFAFPITEILGDGSKIAITFPAGFDIGEASIEGLWGNNDINGWDEGTVSIESISVDEVSRTITLTLNSDAEFGENVENVNFMVDGIVNSSTPGYEYVLSYTTKDQSGATIEGPNDFNNLTIAEAGDGVATISVLESGTDEPIVGATIYFNNWVVGTQTVVTDEYGEASIEGIPVPEWGTDVYAWMDGSNAPDGYKPNWSSQNIHLTTGSPTGSATIYLDAANLRISGTISHEGVGEDGETRVSVWASGVGWTNKTITLDADGSTEYTLYLSDAGYYNIGLDKYYDWMAGGYETAAYITPSSVQRSLSVSNTADDPLDIDFTLEAADKVISITVMDQFGEPIPQVWCSVSSDYAMAKKDSMGGTADTADMAGAVSSFWTGAQSDSNGVCTVNVKEGRYRVEAHMQGISGQMGTSVEVDEDDEIVEVGIVVKKPSIAVSGNVSDENGTGIEYANINCHETTKWENVWANTDSDGDFIFYVNEGTWTCEAWAQNVGFVPAAEGVDVTGFEVTGNVTDLNFIYDSDAFANITGTLLDSEGEPKKYTSLWAERVSTSTKQFGGYGNNAQTDSNGDFSIRVPKNDNDETYRVQMWDQDLGQFILSEDADASEGDVNLGDVSLPQTYEVDVTVAGVPVDQYSAYVNIENRDTWGSWSWVNVALTDGSGSGDVRLAEGDYVAHMWVQGFGESKQEFTVGEEGGSIDFDFSDMVFTEYTVTVSDTDGPVQSAYVEAFDPVNGSHVSNFTDGSGQAVLTVYLDTDSAYEIRANSPSHVSSMVVAEDGVTTYAVTLVSADSTISGTVTNDDDDEIAYAWVDAISTDGTSWVGTMTDGEGNFSLAVPSSTTWNVFVHSYDGSWGTVSAVAAGASGVDLVSDQTMDYFIPQEPFSITINPTVANVVSNDIAELSIPAGALGTDSNGVTISIKKTTAVAGTETSGPLGDFGIDITATDSEGNNITSLNDDVTITMKIGKEQVEAILNDSSSGVASIDEFNAPVGYYDDINAGWTDPTSSVTVDVQETAGGDYVSVSMENFIAGYDSVYSAYADYIVKYIKTTDHFTIFAPIVGGSDDDSDSNDSVSNNTGGQSGSFINKQSDEKVAVTDTNDYATHWAQVYIKELFDRALVSGCGGGNFCPDKNVTRAELLKIAMNVYGVKVEENLPNTFTDVDGHWAKGFVLTASKLGIVSGYNDKTFKPNAYITRAEAVKILLKASSFAIGTTDTQADNPFADVEKDSWHFNYVITASSRGVLQGYEEGGLTYFKPNQPITRAEIAKVALEVEKIAK